MLFALFAFFGLLAFPSCAVPDTVFHACFLISFTTYVCAPLVAPPVARVLSEMDFVAQGSLRAIRVRCVASTLASAFFDLHPIARLVSESQGLLPC
jgi:hypothetical protein